MPSLAPSPTRRRAPSSRLSCPIKRARCATSWRRTNAPRPPRAARSAAGPALARAAASLDPDVRFRALYTLGLLALGQARADTANRDAHLADAERAYREALLLRPRHVPAKWNLELVARMHRSSSNRPNPRPSPTPSGGAPPDQTRGSGAPNPPPSPGSSAGLNEAQADQVLRSIGQEELRT